MTMKHPLKAFRESRNLTQDGLGALLGVTRTTVARWESGLRKIDEGLLPSVAAITGIDPKELRPDLAELFAGAAE